MRLLLLALAVLTVVAVAGCGSSRHAATSAPTTTASAPDPAAAAGGGRILYESDAWAVVVRRGTAVALHLRSGAWHTDRSGAVEVTLIGPHAVDAKTPQVAATLKAGAPLAESALWVDGTELAEKGGGLTATSGTIYGAPSAPLAPGRHVAVAYARTATSATAVARVFRVP